MSKYGKLTHDDFNAYLGEIIDSTCPKPSKLLQIPGIYETLSEHFNNEVLDRWESDNSCQDAESDDSLNS